MALVDSHCHLPLIDNGEDGVDGVVARAGEAGVSHMLCVCVDLETFAGVREAAARHGNVSASVGVHPNTEEGTHEPGVAELVQHAADPDIVAIGETGLDYFRSDGNLDWQRERFRVHIRAARETGLPLIIHCREAAPDLLAIMREERAQDVGGVMHCFVENGDVARAAMDLDFDISFSGIVTFRNATELKEVARQVPLDRLLIETDSPWLAPVPKRGKQNEPAYVRHTAAYIADLRNEAPETVAQATTANFFRRFPRAIGGN